MAYDPNAHGPAAPSGTGAVDAAAAGLLPEGYALRILDAHHHFWDLEGGGHWPWIQDEYNPDFFLGDYNAMRHTFLREQYLAATVGWDVVGTVHCEAERSRSEQVAEDEFLDGLHALDPRFPAAVVGHVGFLQPDLAEVLAGHASHPLVKGIRSKPIIRSSASSASVAGLPGSLQDPEWQAGLRMLAEHGFSWDLRVPYYHLAEAADVVATVPETTVVVNHCGLPLDRSEAGLEIWRDGMRRLAELPNTVVKVSELGLHPNVWDSASNAQVVRETVGFFGFDRSMFASNLPVSTLTAATFDDVMTAVLTGVQGASPAQLDDLFHDTAARTYRVALPTT
jgi:predicted TIM-barrel fold metal-dependent hydrolase